MKKESKLNLNAGDYAISHCDSDKTYNGLEVHKMLCDAYIAGSDDTLEDDDEKVKNKLITLIKMSNEAGGFALHKWEADEMLAWLEKQGEQKPILDFKAKDWYVSKVDGKIHNIYHSVDKIEPIFNVGDKIQYLKGCGTIMTIEKIENGEYIFANNMGHTTIENGNKCYLVERKPAEWHREDEQNLNACLGYIPDEFLRRWLKDVVHAKYDKPVWSEEDEKMFKSLKTLLNDASCYSCTEGVDKILSWLQSLRPQNRWRPSERQLACLQDAIEHYHLMGSPATTLTEILKQLRKLKEGKI